MPHLGLGLSARTQGLAAPAWPSLDFVLGLYGRDHGFHALEDFAGWSFARGSAATVERTPGVVTHHAVDEARIAPGRGLLIERAATNLLLHSQDFSQPVWSRSHDGDAAAPTVAAEVAAAPDGSPTSDRISFNLTGATGDDSSHVFQFVTGLTPDADYSFSIWARGGAGRQVNVVVVGGGRATVEMSGNWRRVELPFRAASGVVLVLVGVSGDLAAGAEDVLLWGAQLEAGGRAGSYIPTVSATATRAADQARVGGLALTLPLTAAVEWRRAHSAGPETASWLYSLGDDDGANAVGAWHDTPDDGVGIVTDVEAATGPASAVAVAAPGGWLATAWSADEARSSLNGAAVVATETATPTAVLTRLDLGGRQGEGQIDGWMRRLTLLPFALSDAGLEGMSA